MQLKHILSFFILFIYNYGPLFAQYENVWVFGNRAGIDFSSGSPVPLPSDSTTTFFPEAAASVCDAKGNFLFYTDGYMVKDRNHGTMPNSVIPLVPHPKYEQPTRNIVSSTTQGALIIPMPDSTNKYYVFSLTASDVSQVDTSVGRLYYSIVDMSLNNGLGDIVPTRKGILVDSALQEKMVSVVGDRCNIWVLTIGNDSYFRAYDITGSGINTQPVLSSVGIGNGATFGGMIAVSPNRKKIASVQGVAVRWMLYGGEGGRYNNFSKAAVALFDFDAASGIVSNPVTVAPYVTLSGNSNPNIQQLTLLRRDSTAHALCFSPDGSKLYYTANQGFGIYQLDLTSGDPTIIQNSRTYIGLSGLSHLKLAPDGKIYFGSSTNSAMIGSINTPNMAGTACQYVSNSLIISPAKGGRGVGGLPNVISVLNRDTIYKTLTIVKCGVDSVQLSATDTSGYDYIWNDGSDGLKRTFNTNGTYWLQYHIPPCVFHTDTFSVNLANLVPVIRVNKFELSTTLLYDTYQWYLNGNIIPGATQPTYIITKNGDYTVVVGDNESDCTNTSAIYKVTNVTSINNISSLRQEIKVYPNPANDIIHIKSPIKVDVNIIGLEGRIIKKVEHAQIVDIKDLAKGIFLLQIRNKEGMMINTVKVIKQ